MTTGQIKPPQPVSASAKLLATARTNCAARLRARGEDREAESFEKGLWDDTWAMRHEINKLRNEGMEG